MRVAGRETDPSMSMSSSMSSSSSSSLRHEPGTAAALARVPGDATIKGMFLNGLIELAEARGVSLQGQDDVDAPLLRHRPSFKDEPLVDFMRLAVAVARAGWPELELAQGLREVGRQTYRTFLQSLTGRVMFGVLGRDIVKLIGASTKAYAVSQSHGRAVVVESSTRGCVLEYTGLYQFLDALEVGVVEEAVLSCGLRPVIKLELTSPVSGLMRISFELDQG